MNKSALANPKANTLNSLEEITTKDNSVNLDEEKTPLLVTNSVLESTINSKILLNDDKSLIVEDIRQIPEKILAEVTLPTQTVAIPRNNNLNQNDLLCEEDCFVSQVKLTPFLAQATPDWDATIAEVTLPTQTVAIPRNNNLNQNDLLCEEDCFVSQVKLTPFLAQATPDWDATIAEVTLPTQTVAIPRNNNLNQNDLLCEEDCFVSQVKLTPFLAQATPDWDATIAEVTLPTQSAADLTPLDRTLDPIPPNTQPTQETTPDPTIESTPIPETAPTTEPVKITRDTVEMLITNAISNTAIRYPWIVNGSDSLTFSPFIFKPRTNEFYLNLDIREAPDNPVLNKVGIGAFSKPHQLYWVLEDNIIVGDVNGGLAGIVYQGMQTNQTFAQTLTQTQSFSGYQAAWVIPNDLQRLFKLDDLNNYEVISLGGQLINPEGVTAEEVTFNTDGLIKKDQEVVILPSPQAINDSQIGVASTFNPNGGGALFANVDVENAPLILQGFPTSNLQAFALLDMKEKSIIPKDVLREAGIEWTNPLTGEGAKVFSPEITSIPGIKTAQQGKFDNENLLNILVNPFLDEKQRDRHYWNSLLWLGLGIQPPQFNTVQVDENKYDWYRIYVSALNNRFLLQYSKEKPEATFYNLFANPGFSLTIPSKDGGRLDEVQSLNSSIGMVMGAFFDFVDLRLLNKSIKEAKKQRNNNELFKPLNTKATSEERKEINQRLNTTLAFGNLGSNLNQVSGYITFPSVITPTSSSMFQIKTGNIQRAVQFVQSDVGEWIEGETTIKSARLSNRSFGPLTFLGNSLPIQPIGFKDTSQPVNESSGSQVILVSPEGKQFVQEFNSKYLTAIPNAIKAFDLAFDRLVLERKFTRNIDNKIYNGYIYLPTIEFVYAGTSNDWNYSVNPGIWFNVNNEAAGEVKRNDFGIPEPSVGVYINTVVSKTITNTEFDENKQLTGISTHVPFFRFSWNSANNSNNPWQITLAYTYSRQTRNYGLSLTGSLGYIPQYGNGPFVGFFNGRFGFANGPSIKGNVELGDQIYYNAELLQKIIPTVSIGPYIRNYIDLNQGFNSRELEISYGGIIEYKLTDSPVSMRVELGSTENNQFIGSIKGDVRF
ncbi:leucine-rich repeat (LRR) protein [Geminocystis sp. NIES-3708]|uniref:hypothetical protein n=1 Tax=Geminocystis sp. NIES-3708 TaxID=1615909 RepID=UPI0005FC602B|nr:hypothetical protein [Geminocystis sp. NIES-3708]BAQ59910.1 leucine-rich repeat (LRR) protein [Geminocystis sp. NIES-3708]